MADKKTFLNIFNTQLLNFVDDIILLWPSDNDFKVFKNAIVLLKKTNPRKINTLFREYINKYRTKIQEKDESFFLENEYQELEKTENVLDTMDKLKKYWSKLSDINKEKIWEYFNLLIRISDKIV